jgi:transposase
MSAFSLDKKLRQKVDQLLRTTVHAKVLKRLYALLWLDDGKSIEEVAQLLQHSTRTIRGWLRIYRRHGLDGLLVLHYKGDAGQLKPAQVEQLKNEIKTGKFHCARQVQTFIKDTFQVNYSLSGTTRLLQRIGCSFHQVNGFLFKADRDQQLKFVEKYEAQRPKPGEATRRYFIDGTHPRWGLDMLFRCWLLRGQRFEVGVGGGRKRLNILGAISPEDREYIDIRLPLGTLSYQQVIELLQKLRQKHPEIKKFILYLDNARYQHARALKEWIEAMKAEGVEFVLEHLPAYSPNLNLIERLWKFLRKHALQKWHETFEAMQAAIASVLDNLDQYADELATLLTEKFHIRPAA